MYEMVRLKGKVHQIGIRRLTVRLYRNGRDLVIIQINHGLPITGAILTPPATTGDPKVELERDLTEQMFSNQLCELDLQSRMS